MKYNATTFKSNISFALYGIALILYIDTKVILPERNCENGKLKKLEPPRNENSTFGERTSELGWKSCLVKWQI